MQAIVDQLLASDEPSIRYKMRTGLLGEDPQSPAIRALREEIRISPRVADLLSERSSKGTIPGGVYTGWTGAHWVMAALAGLGYPPGDPGLAPLVDQVCASWLSEKHIKSVPTIHGRTRRCASQEANTLWSMLMLGFIDEHADRLAENLIRWQWPDGGWNCDKNPSASKSSFHETWLPLRALSLYGRVRGNTAACGAAERAKEIFLSRRLFRKLSDGTVMKTAFVKLSYPHYWHYGILAGLTVMAEAGFIRDPRCVEAIDLLEEKRLANGGFPAETSHYHTSRANYGRRYSAVKWGAGGAAQMNEWVTAEALKVLAAAGRL